MKNLAKKLSAFALAILTVAALAVPTAAWAAEVGLQAGAADSPTLTVAAENAAKLENGKTYIFYSYVNGAMAMTGQTKYSSQVYGFVGAKVTLSGTTATFADAEKAQLAKFTVVSAGADGQFYLLNDGMGVYRSWSNLRLTDDESQYSTFALSGTKLYDVGESPNGSSDNYVNVYWDSSYSYFKGWANSSSIIYAREVVEEAATYAVNFESNGGTAVESATVEAGGAVARPADPTRENYVFAGWYKDEACTQEWDFAADTVNAVTTLYAKWESATGETPTVRVMRVFKFVPGKSYVIVDSGKSRALSGDVAPDAVQYGNARDAKPVTWSADGGEVTFASIEAKAASLWAAEAADAGDDAPEGLVKLKNGSDYLGSSNAALHFPAAAKTTDTLDDEGNVVSSETTVTDNVGFYVNGDYVLTGQSDDKETYSVSYSNSFKGFMANASSSKSSAYVYQVLAEGEEHVHQLVHRDAVAATCEKAGAQEYWECADCGEKFADAAGTQHIDAPAAVPALGHEWGAWTEVDADSHQRACTHDASHVETAAHTWGEGVVTVEPTAEAEGVMTYTCADCGATHTEPIAKTAGSCAGEGAVRYLVQVERATELEAGKRYVVLSADGAFAMTSANRSSTYGTFLDAAPVSLREADGVVAFASPAEAALSAWTCAGVDFFTFSQGGKYLYGDWAYLSCDDPSDHDGAKGTAFGFEVDGASGLAKLYQSNAESYRVGYDTRDGVFSASGDKTCAVYEVVGELGLVAASSHDLVKTEAHAASCEEPGNIAYYTCAKCGKVYADAAGEAELSADEVVVPATGHTPHLHEAVAATCEEEGADAYYECDVCGKFFSDEACEHEIAEGSWTVAALGHDYGEGVVTTPATCTEDGVLTYTCQHDPSHAVTEAIPATGHKFVLAKHVDALCEEEGYDLYRCEYCGETEKRHVVPALGHAWNDGVVTKDPTTTEEGERTFTCTRCGEQKVEPIAKLEPAAATAGAGAAKAANPLSVKAKAVKAKASKKVKVKASKAFTVKGAQGKVTYKKASGNKKISVSAAGKVTVKKGLKAGKTYKVRVRVTAAGNANFNGATQTVTLKVKVK